MIRTMRISIITVNLNNAVGLRRTIESVVAQEGADLEYFVVDGGSTDGSVDAILEHSDEIDRWVSEPDEGIYEAMNKGLRWASGEYCLFLNSGDWLVDTGVLARAIASVHGEAGVYYADLLNTDGHRTWKREYPRELDVNFFLGGTISHQNSLIRRELLLEAGLYREDFRISSDWYFFLYAIHRLGTSFQYLSEPIAYFYFEGLGTDPRYAVLREEERRRGLRDVFGPLSRSIEELLGFRESIYGRIAKQYGVGRVLTFLLRAYRRTATIFFRR